MAKKCGNCGLVNWDHDEICKRCAASLHTGPTPPVYKWFIAYCVCMALLYISLPVIGVGMLFVEPDQDMSAAEAKFMSFMFIVLGLVFFVPYAAAPFLPRKNWVWILGLVLICIGLTSMCCLPACIPLLIYWLKPEMKAFYGRTATPMPPPPPQWG